MRNFSVYALKSTALLLFFFHVALVSCSRRIQLVSNTGNTETPANITDTGKKEDFSVELEKSVKARRTVAGTPAKAEITNNSELTPEIILNTAEKYFGIPYCFGGTTTRCLDCSGLLVRVFAEHGIDLPHNSQAQSKQGMIINNKNDLVKGDLVFFTGSYNTKNRITHSGIYAGDNKFIHSSTSKGVTVTSLDDPYWKNKFAFGSRLLEN
jgi:murein DD-endopeptidase / murein LD-carboxypeptidase